MRLEGVGEDETFRRHPADGQTARASEGRGTSKEGGKGSQRHRGEFPGLVSGAIPVTQAGGTRLGDSAQNSGIRYLHKHCNH